MPTWSSTQRFNIKARLRRISCCAQFNVNAILQNWICKSGTADDNHDETNSSGLQLESRTGLLLLFNIQGSHQHKPVSFFNFYRHWKSKFNNNMNIHSSEKGKPSSFDSNSFKRVTKMSKMFQSILFICVLFLSIYRADDEIIENKSYSNNCRVKHVTAASLTVHLLKIFN